jgi:type VI protein secretion system component Hcp
MTIRKSLLAAFGLLLISGLVAFALAATGQTMFITLQGLPNPNHGVIGPAGPITIVNFTEVGARRTAAGSPGNPGRFQPAMVAVVKTVDTFSAELHQAAQQGQRFPTATFSFYDLGPSKRLILTERVVLTNAKITDDHLFTDKATYGNNPMESMSFTYDSLATTDYPPPPKPTTGTGKVNTTLQ